MVKGVKRPRLNPWSFVDLKEQRWIKKDSRLLRCHPIFCRVLVTNRGGPGTCLFRHKLNFDTISFNFRIVSDRCTCETLCYKGDEKGHTGGPRKPSDRLDELSVSITPIKVRLTFVQTCETGTGLTNSYYDFKWSQ